VAELLRKHGGHATGYIRLGSGTIAYDLSVVGPGARGPTDYRYNNVAISFEPNPPADCLTLTITNLSAKTVVVRWGSHKMALTANDVEQPVLLYAAQVGSYDPFLGQGKLEMLETNINIPPSHSESVFLTGQALAGMSKSGITMKQQLLPSDSKEARQLRGQTLKLLLPMLIAGQETKLAIRFLVNEVEETH
jgi:hypothetical protein